jgi:diguanylate cyclase (GGDEF)-like protein
MKAPAGSASAAVLRPRRGARTPWLDHHALFSRFRIGTRLAAMMVLAGLVAVLLAASGIRGLADANESLHMVYEGRMKPVRTLGQISHLMLANQHQLQIALGQTATGGGPSAITLDPQFALKASEAIEHNVHTIDRLWDEYASGPLSAQERTLAARFATRRNQYLEQAVSPVLDALRTLNYQDTRRLATGARALYERASPDIQALVDLQFEMAHAAYAAGVQRYNKTRWMAVNALLASMAVLTVLGVILIRSIVQPLQAVKQVFQHISDGKLDSAIEVQGNDEISQLLIALREMQAKLGANEKAIHHLAYYDPLTNLPNRRLLKECIQAALTASNRDDYHRALLLLDLDNFKTINDTLGHELGDAFLVDTAQRLRHAVQAPHFVARIGGDEFVVLVDRLPAEEAAALGQVNLLADQLLAAVAGPCLLAGQWHHGSASIGICLFHHHNATIKDLLKRADAAMYQAKNAGRNNHRLFDPAMQAQLETRTALEAALRSAVARGQMELHFQVQVNGAMQATGAEVLLRWSHPTHGPIPPAQFIPIAEASGLIHSIGAWVLQRACAQLKAWDGQAHTRHLELAVNVSAQQFRHPDFVAHVCDALDRAGANPGLLVLELTESLVLHDIADTVQKMQALRRHGVRFALDDFGTGYSSLSHLKQLPLHHLKVDGCFVRDIVTDPSDAVIVQTIIGMARNLGLCVIAEGVEAEAQRQVLLNLQCPVYQGYLFSRPLPLAQFEQWLGMHCAATSAACPPTDSPTPLPQATP